MTELRDVFTKDGTPTGRTWKQGTKRTNGDYYLHAVVILRTPDGRYPLAQRMPDDDYFPGMWDVTGGGVRAGETPAQGGAREVREELGVSVDPDKLVFLNRYRLDYEDGTGSHVFMFGAVFNSPGVYSYDPKEVNAVIEVRFDEFIKTVMYNKDAAFARALTEFEDSFRQ